MPKKKRLTISIRNGQISHLWPRGCRPFGVPLVSGGVVVGGDDGGKKKSRKISQSPSIVLKRRGILLFDFFFLGLSSSEPSRGKLLIGGSQVTTGQGARENTAASSTPKATATSAPEVSREGGPVVPRSLTMAKAGPKTKRPGRSSCNLTEEAPAIRT